MMSRFIVTRCVRLLIRTNVKTVRLEACRTCVSKSNGEDEEQEKLSGKKNFKEYSQASYFKQTKLSSRVSPLKLKSVAKPRASQAKEDSHDDTRTDVVRATEKQELKCIDSSSPERKGSDNKFVNLPGIYFRASEIDVIDDDDAKEVQGERGEVPIDEVAPYLGESYNLAKFVQRSETLQQLIKLGVRICDFDIDPDLAEFILKLNFDKDIKPYIQFLTDKGVPSDQLGKFFTKNPQVLKVSLDNLQVRINYLESKKFDKEAIASILTRTPRVLRLSTRTLDGKLGYLQKKFRLSGDEVRKVVIQLPKVVMAETMKIEENNVALYNECGFSDVQLKHLFLSKPRIWIAKRDDVRDRFRFLHSEIGLSHERICQFPGSLLCRKWKMEQRHSYLSKIGRAQYDPMKANYVSLDALVRGTDNEFCENVAKTSISKFNEFLLTL